MNTNILNVGIAGLGRLGKRHAEQLARNTPGARLVAACSPVAAELDWARNELGVARCHDTLEAMLADADIDAIVLVTPTTLHADQTSACLRAGKHVFVEKPLSLDVATCEAVEAVAQEHPQLVASCAASTPATPRPRPPSTRANWAGPSWCARRPVTRTTPTVSL
jgi:myo-inositol 2-dehydrogenase / D-chiro-inositol 1-dehydrogenase